MSRPLRLFIVNRDRNMQPKYVKRPTTGLVPPGKIRLPSHAIQIHQSVLEVIILSNLPGPNFHFVAFRRDRAQIPTIKIILEIWLAPCLLTRRDD
jgi:hypothetical protein